MIDPYDAPLSALRNHVDELSTWLGIWCNRSEPDAHARRCANDAMDAIDAMRTMAVGNPARALRAGRNVGMTLARLLPHREKSACPVSAQKSQFCTH